MSKVQINHLGLQDPLWNRKFQWGVSYVSSCEFSWKFYMIWIKVFSSLSENLELIRRVTSLLSASENMQFCNEQIRTQPLFAPPCASATYGSARMCRWKNMFSWQFMWLSLFWLLRFDKMVQNDQWDVMKCFNAYMNKVPGHNHPLVNISIWYATWWPLLELLLVPCHHDQVTVAHLKIGQPYRKFTGTWSSNELHISCGLMMEYADIDLGQHWLR